ncbi:MAG: hypothetical protein ACC707_04350 [Thiohalomonadales bacterium]
MFTKYVVFVMFALFSGSILAGSEALRHDFRALEFNNDGFINLTEAATEEKILASWEKIDLNTDQLLDLTEITSSDSAKTYVPDLDSDEPEVGSAEVC